MPSGLSKPTWPRSKYYDGHHGYYVDSLAHTYRRLTRPSAIQGLASQGGGHLLVPDLVHLDTGQVARWEFRLDVACYYLTLLYADLPAYEVRRWRKLVTLARATHLPMVLECTPLAAASGGVDA